MCHYYIDAGIHIHSISMPQSFLPFKFDVSAQLKFKSKVAEVVTQYCAVEECQSISFEKYARLLVTSSIIASIFFYRREVFNVTASDVVLMNITVNATSRTVTFNMYVYILEHTAVLHHKVVQVSVCTSPGLHIVSYILLHCTLIAWVYGLVWGLSPACPCTYEGHSGVTSKLQFTPLEVKSIYLKMCFRAWQKFCKSHVSR